jgi:NTP pyrophosphatase (non-canonical NTP hydrolase)
MNTSNFRKVVHFNQQFGVIPSSVISPQPFTLQTNPQGAEFCMKLIREEVKELEEAVKEKDYVESADALADILYVVYGMGARLGIDLDEAFELVHQNNMSKLCSTEEEALETVRHYQNNFEKFGYDSPTYRKSPDGMKYVVFNKSTGKVLKSIKWIPVNLTYLLDR